MIQVYNTMTGEKMPFTPIEEGKVKMYVCGVTVYDYIHIGNARSAVAFDVIRRYLQYRGYDVTFVKNFTDIDDKIINRSNESGENWKDLTKRMIAAHNEDMSALNVMTPDLIPHATEYVDKMVDYISVLIDKGYAYPSHGDVYYRVTKFDGYGKLSKKNIDDLQVGARIEANEQKENPLDFVLWKAAKPGEPSWESPWGAGRPGWHIECSVMSNHLLGVPFDIHGGGKDLTFPHHENEIAQTEAHSDCTFANYWMHNGFLSINKEKMSKSLGNFFTVRDIRAQFDAEAVRYFLVTSQYRQPLDFSDEKIQEAESSLDRVYTFLDELNHAQPAGKKGSDLEDDVAVMLATFFKNFESAMDDDFNTPMALAALFEAVRAGNSILAAKPKAPTLDALTQAAHEIIDVVNKVLGVITRTPEEWFKANLTIPEDEVTALIAERNEARKEKNFARSDEIRDMLKEKGVELIDTLTGTRYRTKKIRQA